MCDPEKGRKWDKMEEGLASRPVNKSHFLKKLNDYDQGSGK